MGLTGLLPTGVPPWKASCAGSTRSTRSRPTTCVSGCTWPTCGTATRCCSTDCSPNTSPRCCPVIYTPTVGLAIERFSQEFRRTRGVYLSVDHPEDVETALRNTGLGPDDIDLLVATDSEGILGIGDQGVGGIEISIGKLAVYTAAAGIHPRRVLPVVLDMGTDNLKLLNDDLYLGARHARVRDQRYDDLIDAYVTAVSKLFPNAMLHWEDFGATNARRILNKYADQVCTFNDDMQGTAATVMAAAFSAVRAAGTRIRDQRVVIYGAGTAGLGIADMMREQMIREGLTPDEATRRFYPMGSQGLLVDDDPDPAGLPTALRPRPRRGRRLGHAVTGRPIGLAEVVGRVHPTMLIGTSTHAGAFTEAIVKDMAAHTDRPIIMPLSNPTSKCEACPRTCSPGPTAASSPPPAARSARSPTTDGPTRSPQSNNALIFPGLGPRCHRRPGPADQRQHDHRRRHRRRPDVGPDEPRRIPAPAHGRPAHRRRRRGHRRGHRGGRGRPRPGRAPRPDPTSARRHVAARLPATSNGTPADGFDQWVRPRPRRC